MPALPLSHISDELLAYALRGVPSAQLCVWKAASRRFCVLGEQEFLRRVELSPVGAALAGGRECMNEFVWQLEPDSWISSRPPRDDPSPKPDTHWATMGRGWVATDKERHPDALGPEVVATAGPATWRRFLFDRVLGGTAPARCGRRFQFGRGGRAQTQTAEEVHNVNVWTRAMKYNLESALESTPEEFMPDVFWDPEDEDTAQMLELAFEMSRSAFKQCTAQNGLFSRLVDSSKLLTARDREVQRLFWEIDSPWVPFLEGMGLYSSSRAGWVSSWNWWANTALTDVFGDVADGIACLHGTRVPVTLEADCTSTEWAHALQGEQQPLGEWLAANVEWLGESVVELFQAAAADAVRQGRRAAFLATEFG